jgi:hypothetical protein
MAKNLIPNNNALVVDEFGFVLFKVPHGTFYSSATQNIASVTAAQMITFEKSIDVERLTHSTAGGSNSRIYIQSSGSYEIVFSGLAYESAADKKHLALWLMVDGGNVEDSNTLVEIATKEVEMTVVASFIYDLTAGQYIELATWGDSLTSGWLATDHAHTPDRPACPSVVMTIKKISSRYIGA